MPVEIRQKNPNAISEILNRYRSDKVLAVGYPLGTDGVSVRYPDGTPVLDVAARNNFGDPSRRIPVRDFMGAGGVRALEKTQPIAAKLVGRVNRGEITVEDMLDILAPVAVAEFQQAIIDIDTPPNSPSTIARKGSSNPLVDTGLLNQSLTYIVRGK